MNLMCGNQLNDQNRPEKPNWMTLFAYAVLIYVSVIGGVEGFWRLFTGGYSPLLGGLGLVCATLFVVRMIGETRSFASHRPFQVE